MNDCNLIRYGLSSLFIIGGILGFIWVYMDTLSVCDKNKKRVRLYKKVMDLIELVFVVLPGIVIILFIIQLVIIFI